MFRFLIYLFPAMMDCVLGAVAFLTTVRMAESGASATKVSLLLTIWSAIYMIGAFALSRIITSQNADKLTIMGAFLLVIVSLGFVIFPHIAMMYVLMVFVAISCALFFAPFQIFMKTVESHYPAGIVRSTALYTFSWSTGIALGPFIAGVVWSRFGWSLPHVINATFAFMTAIGIIILRGYVKPSSAKSSNITVSNSGYEDRPDFAWLGWLAAGAGIFVVMMVRAILPITGVALSVPKAKLGTVFMLISLTQGLVGLSFIKSKFWMFKVKPIVFLSLFGLLGLLGFAFAESTIFLYISAIGLGIYSGMIFFYFVFHSLVHPEKAPQYIAINESIVGLVGIMGPFAGGLVVDILGLRFAYLLGGMIILFACIFKSTIHYRCSATN